MILYRGYPLNDGFVVEEWDTDGSLVDVRWFA